MIPSELDNRPEMKIYLKKPANKNNRLLKKYYLDVSNHKKLYYWATIIKIIIIIE